MSVSIRNRLGLVAAMTAAIALTAGAMITSTAQAQPVVGQAAPDFSVTTTQGQTLSLDDLAGKRVILEWTNHGCPFVQKHYDASHKNMQGLQSEYADGSETVWLTVISSAPGKQGYLEAADADAQAENSGATPSHIVLDPTGALGHLFDAKTTPHMFVIDKDAAQTLIYAGAIDDKPSTNPDHIPTSENYLRAVMTAAESGAAVNPSSTKPYGCSIKYAS